MIIKDTDAPDRGVIDATFEGDNLKVTHVQDVDPILKDLQLRKLEQNEGGFSDDRSMRFLGTVPMSVFALHPEFLHDTKALVKWMETDPVGQNFCVNRSNTGRSGKTIIK